MERFARILMFVAFATASVMATPAIGAEPHRKSDTSSIGQLDAQYVRQVNGSLERVGLGIDQGLFGKGQFVQGLKLQVPFGRHVGMRVRPMWLHGSYDGDYDPSVVGRVELYGSSPVMGGIVRLYGGGGPQVGFRPDFATASDGGEVTLGGGGFFGFEFFMAPKSSFFLEVGGQSAAHSRGLGAGASVMSGIQFYL